MRVFQGTPGNAVIWQRLMQWPNGLHKLAIEIKKEFSEPHPCWVSALHVLLCPALCWLCFVLPCLRFGGLSQHRDSTTRSPLPQLLGNEDKTSAHCIGSAVRGGTPKPNSSWQHEHCCPGLEGLALKSLQSALGPHSQVFLNYLEIAAAVTSRTAIFSPTGLVYETDLNHTLILFQYPVPKRKIA